MGMAKGFGDLVRLKRKRLGITAEELAEKVGVDRTYISKIENLNIAPALPIYYQICKILSISLKDNLTVKGGKKKEKLLKEILGLLGKK